jgi:hypothetical protein
MNIFNKLSYLLAFSIYKTSKEKSTKRINWIVKAFRKAFKVISQTKRENHAQFHFNETFCSFSKLLFYIFKIESNCMRNVVSLTEAENLIF